MTRMLQVSVLYSRRAVYVIITTHESFCILDSYIGEEWKLFFTV